MFAQTTRALALVLALVALTMAGALKPASAAANGTDCAATGSVPHFDVPSGTLCLDVIGSGLKIQSATAAWYGVGKLCHYKFHVYWYDLQNRHYATTTGPLHRGCSWGAAAKYFKLGQLRYRVTPREGRACTVLTQSGEAHPARPCVAIIR